MKRVLNTTPHDVNAVKVNGGENIYPKSTCQIRVIPYDKKVGEIDGMEIFKEELGPIVIDDPDNLLEKADILIMSRVAATKAKENKFYDKYIIWIPGALIRDSDGRIIGCRGFIEV